MDGLLAAVGGCLLLASAIMAWVLYLQQTAPLGYEDADGFHFGEEPIPVAVRAWPPLTADERLVLCQMSPEIGRTVGTLANWTGLPHKRVTDARRSLAGKGLAFLTTLRSDGGESNQLAGCGYLLTPTGANYAEQLEDGMEFAA